MQYKSFSEKYRIYYEHTDAAGVVYHSYYLNFAEKARSDALRSCQINQNKLYQDQGLSFVVYQAGLKILKSAQLDDLLEVKTIINQVKGAVIKFDQPIFLDNKKICEINVDVVFLNKNKKPAKIPNFILSALV